MKRGWFEFSFGTRVGEGGGRLEATMWRSKLNLDVLFGGDSF